MTTGGTVLKRSDVIDRLRAACKAVGGQKIWAARHGISFGYLNDVLNGRRPPGDSVLRTINLQRAEPTYEARRLTEVSLYAADGSVLVTAWAS